MTLFRAVRDAILIFRDVNYPISLQTSTLDGVTSFLLLRNVQNKCKIARYSLNKPSGKLKRSVQDGEILAKFEGIFHFFDHFVC